MTYLSANRGHWATPLAGLKAGTAALALLSASAAFAATPAPPPAASDADAAAAADDGGDAIIVTARHREENAQAVPLAISVLSAESLEKTGNYSINQIQQQVPTLQVTITNPRNSAIAIRGLGASSALAVDGLEYGVGFYVDGVYYGRPGQSQFDLVDLQRIEVLRGPQGTLFGKNTTAGALNITTQAPSFTPEFTGEVSGGNYGYHQVRGTVSGPLIADKLAVRLSVSDTHRDGFLKNTYDGSKAEDYDNFAVRGQLLAKPTDNLTIRLIGDYAKQKQHYALTLIAGYFTKFADGTAVGNNVLQRAAALNYTLPDGNAFERRGAADSPFQANMKSYGVSNQIDWDLGPVTLTSITAYRWWDWDPANDTDGTSLPILTKGQLADRQRQFSEEFRVASNGSHLIDYQLGLYYYWQKLRGYGQTAFGADFVPWSFPAATPSATLALATLSTNNFEADSYSNPTTRSYAAFGQTDLHISDKLTLTTGLRFTHEDKSGSFTQYAVSGVDLSTLSATTAAAVNAFRTSLGAGPLSFSGSYKNDALSGLATLSYKVTPDVYVYGTYSRGSKSGGLNLTAGGLLHPGIAPEKVDNFEVGLKSQWFDHRLTANLAAYLTNVKDYQTPITQTTGTSNTVIQYISNIPKVRSKGIEGDLNFAPTKWISFNASGAYTDAKYVSYTNALQAPERLDQSQTQDLSGVQLPNVPKFSYTLGADLAAPVDTLVPALGGSRLLIYGHADYAHRSSVNSSVNNSIYGIINPYGILNARIGLRSEDGHWDVSLWARNLLNKNYYTILSAGQGTTAGSVTGLITGVVGDPRTLGATLRTKF